MLVERIADGYAAMDHTSEKSAPDCEDATRDDKGRWPGNAQASSLYDPGEERDLRVDKGALHALHKLLARTRLQAHSSLMEDDQRRAAVEQECGEPPQPLALYHERSFLASPQLHAVPNNHAFLP